MTPRQPRGVRAALMVLIAWAAALPAAVRAQSPGRGPIEVPQRLALAAPADKPIALTLDACGGRFDAELIAFLAEQRLPATLFVTARWIRANPAGVQAIRAHRELFQIENHGERHIPAVIGPGRRVYGIAGHADMAGLRHEIRGGDEAIQRAFGTTPRWYRAATARYDPAALDEIARLGWQVAGFSLNADAGASLPRRAVEGRMARAQPGDIAIAHMNRPQGDTYEGLRPALLALKAAGFRFVRLDQAANGVLAVSANAPNHPAQ